MLQANAAAHVADTQTLAQRIESFLVERKMTAVELAKRSNVSGATISKARKGEKIQARLEKLIVAVLEGREPAGSSSEVVSFGPACDAMLDAVFAHAIKKDSLVALATDAFRKLRELNNQEATEAVAMNMVNALIAILDSEEARIEMLFNLRKVIDDDGDGQRRP